MKVRSQQRDQVVRVERLSQKPAAPAGFRALGRHVVVARDEDDGRTGAPSDASRSRSSNPLISPRCTSSTMHSGWPVTARRRNSSSRSRTSPPRCRFREALAPGRRGSIHRHPRRRPRTRVGSCRHHRLPRILLSESTLDVPRLPSSTPLDFGPTCPPANADGPRLENGVDALIRFPAFAPRASAAPRQELGC